MHPTASCFLLLVAAATCLSLTSHALQLRPHIARAAGACVPRERDALLAFKEGITKDPAGSLASWRRGEDCCRWRGVRCSNRTGSVLMLQLRAVPVPCYVDVALGFDTFSPCSDGTALVGEITPSLLSLEHLEHLDLSWNSLEGPTGRLPEFLGSMKSLRYLNLSNIPFTSILPPQLGNLSNLQYLDLSGRETGGMMNSTDMSWLTHLPLLRYLDLLTSVNLSMVSNWAHVVNVIPSLRVLYLSACELQSANQSLPHLNLTKLERLDLSFNPFNHESASCWFWSLTSLKYLYLEYTGLSGQIPDTLAGMTSLQVFDFSLNDNQGTMEPNLLRNICNLEILNLEGSLTSGNITELFESLLQCSSTNKLQELHLSSNNITGTLPTCMGQFTSLVNLDLSGNALTGPVPSEIGMLTNLTSMDLSHNDLHGVITEEHFAGLHSLKFIDLSGNHLKVLVRPEWLPPFRLEMAYLSSCQMGPQFPVWLQLLVDVEEIDISSNGITAQLLDWFSTVFAKARVLDFSKNRISGSLPTNMETMSLEELILASNQITGQIPPLPRNLTRLDISRNSLSGPLPSNFGTPNLECMYLSFNYFSGHIPGSICELQMLNVLGLSNNLFEGEFPQCFGMTEMQTLLLSNNSFSGMFPSFLQGCTTLGYLDLSRNKFCGRLPTWIGELNGLQYLRLSYNLFHGDIPSNITNLGRLYDLNLAGNRLSGVIPSRLSKLMVMTGEIYTSYDPLFPHELADQVSVVTKRQELYYGNALPVMVSIDLSLNCLTGGIPEEIASLAMIKNLNLSKNYLSGEIPDKIGSMHSMESLDLSSNKLFGEIPISLSNLTYLGFLDLSYNNLSGRIPLGTQLDSLYTNYPYMYKGNNGLCGPPLQKNCSGGIASKQDDGDHKRTTAHIPEPMFFYLGSMSGFVVGLWMVFCAMLFKKTWRIAYFRFFDNVYDKIYVFVVVTWASLAQKTTT